MGEDVTMLVVMVIIILFCIQAGYGSEVEKDLGQAICEVQFDKDFDSYDFFTQTLKCKNPKPKKQIHQYDGITVRLDAENPWGDE